jgi:hypothetical protein
MKNPLRIIHTDLNSPDYSLPPNPKKAYQNNSQTNNVNKSK